MSITIQRNDPCPCGSGKKYKKCCMNKESIVQLHQVREERFLEKKHALTERLRNFLDVKLSYTQFQRLFNLFRKRVDRSVSEEVEQGFFDFWLFYFHRFENGLRGIEWLMKEQGAKLSATDRKLVNQWTSLKPRLIEATGKTESTILFTDVITKESFAVPFPNEKLTTFTPWYGTLALLEPFGEHDHFHGVNAMISPEGVEAAKRKVKELAATSGFTEAQVLVDYYPELLAASIKPKSLDGRDRLNKDIYLYKIQADVLDEEKVAAYFFPLEEFVIDEWSEAKKQASWATNWKVYQDTEIEEDIFLADVNGQLTIENSELTYTSYE